MRSVILAVLCSLAALPAAAQDTCRDGSGLPEPRVQETAPQPNQFYRVAGRGLACAVGNAEGEAMSQHERPVTFLPCLRIGAVGIADGRAAVEQLLGQPQRTRDLNRRSQLRVYAIPQRSLPEPMYVVTYQDDVVVGLQMFGPPTEMPATFAGMALGDPVEKVIDTLGTPSRRCLTRSPGTETWMWQPFPIGVDVLDGRVVGFKVTWPAGRPTPD
ncbi:MAG TPA: hypothetical protein VK196_12320 [Magnetospirillum sp.]|nr:hypothetical protein [Magnetospirillum sp.]